MLRAAVFDDFKGATTLLLWGDSEGMVSLLSGFRTLRDGIGNQFAIDGPGGGLTVCSTSELRGGSTLEVEGSVLRWACSRDTVELAADLIEPLLIAAGHQFLDVNGLAEQVVIARDEYPPDLL